MSLIAHYTLDGQAGVKPNILNNTYSYSSGWSGINGTTLINMGNGILHKIRTNITTTTWFEAPLYSLNECTTLLPGHTYTWSFKKYTTAAGSDGDSGWFFRCYDSNNTVIFDRSATVVGTEKSNQWNLFKCTFTMPSAYTRIYFTNTVATNCDYYMKEWKIEENDEPTAYIPNQSESVWNNIPYNLEANIVNGGSTYNGTYSAGPTHSTDTPRYFMSTHFGIYATPYLDLHMDSKLSSLTSCSISWWAKEDVTGYHLMFTGQNGNYYIAAYNTSATSYNGSVGSNTITFYKDGASGGWKSVDTNWHHYVITGLNLSSWTKMYVNHYSSNWPLNSYISDIRIYDSVLTLNDVKELYSGGKI